MRRWIGWKGIVMAAVFHWVSGATASTPAAVQAVADATGAALQADTGRAVARLGAVPAAQFEGDDHTFRTCMMQRFGRDYKDRLPPKLTDPFARQTLEAYRTYWRTALAKPAAASDAEAQLLRRLQQLLNRKDVADLDALEPVLATRLKKSGYYALQGRTGSLRDLMLWTKQETRPIKVELPEGTHTTQVFLLDDFVSLGWGDFATCHRRGTGGWATSEGLYAVVPRYPSIDGEEFRVTFLGHETQHFADLARFSGLKQWELEYRAKLVEVAQADKTRARLLRKFTEDQGDDPAAPHAYANKRVMEALVRQLNLPEGAPLDKVDREPLQAAAIKELREDTQRLESVR